VCSENLCDVVRKRRSRKDVGERKERKPVGWWARERRRMLDEGVYRYQNEPARGEGVSTAAVSIPLWALRER